jgi:hypothetical protein
MPEIPQVRPQERDDRTLRTIRHLVGVERAELALTHFASARVVVVASASTLASPNGWTATRLTMNMLSRFVGTTTLRTVGRLDPALIEQIDREITYLRAIDTREGRQVFRVSESTPDVGAAAVLLIGAVPVVAADVPAHSLISLGFDAWTCTLRRGGNIVRELPASRSEVPFGGLAAACFGVAEVFKTLIADAVDRDAALSFRKRFTTEWSYDVWQQERIHTQALGGPAGLDPLPQVSFGDVLQVGAGAVGNATAFTFAAVGTAAGLVPVLDVKVVDEKNLNRCLFFREPDVGNSKVEVLEREASRPGFTVQGIAERYTDTHGRDAFIILSTVDNNEARHSMQETLPPYVVQGSTGDTTIAVSAHTATNGLSCLVCRHPDRSLGSESRRPLTVSEAAAMTGLPETVIATGMIDGAMVITDALIGRVRQHHPGMAQMLVTAREEGRDLCGALGDLRAQFGLSQGPREASVPFVSALGGVLAAAEVVKLLLKRSGVPNVPVLENVVELDLARDYARHATVAFREPATENCALCQERADDIRAVHDARRATNT